ncbi:LysR family transcriptional regulator [Phyllobacterium sp. SB3]|uniref:helix-turn-helix domain-containing protein n=1 Tax=Phyllobacterium sp. SB3 TaxID=3156073 RepID=UPI0032AF7543
MSSGRIPMIALVRMLAVAEYLGFHRATLAFGTSQSSVSIRIKALETNPCAILFDRNTRGVLLSGTSGRIKLLYFNSPCRF